MRPLPLRIALTFALACSIAASVLFGLGGVLPALRERPLESTRGATLGRVRLRTQNLLVIVQMAVALCSLIAGALVGRGFLAEAFCTEYRHKLPPEEELPYAHPEKKHCCRFGAENSPKLQLSG